MGVAAACIYFAYAETYSAARAAVAAGDPERIAGVEQAVSRLPPAERTAASLALEDVQRARPLRPKAYFCEDHLLIGCSCEEGAGLLR